MIRLVQTCMACPEQYDAFDGDEQVGYLRLRYGYFHVECPNSGGEAVYHAYPRGDGIFYDDERDRYLRFAVAAIEAWVKDKNNAPNVEYTVEYC